MEEPLAELTGYFRRRSEVPDAELVRLAAAARSGGSRWDAIAADCGERDYHHDTIGVVGLPPGKPPIPGQNCCSTPRITPCAT